VLGKCVLVRATRRPRCGIHCQHWPGAVGVKGVGGDREKNCRAREALRGVHGHKRCSAARARSRLSQATSISVLVWWNLSGGRRRWQEG
jgi:hypothetical protein